MKNLDRAIRNAIACNHSTTDSSELLSAILKEFGGAQPLAREIKKSYDEATGMAKQRYMEMFQRLILFTTKEDLSGKIDPSELSDEELLETAKGVLQKITQEKLGVESSELPVNFSDNSQLSTDNSSSWVPVPPPVQAEDADPGQFDPTAPEYSISRSTPEREHPRAVYRSRKQRKKI